MPSSENVDTTDGSLWITPACLPPWSSTPSRINTKGIPNLHRDPAAVSAFRTMKKKLMSAPILACPRFHGKPFILDTDFSVDPGAIGGVLSQEQDGQERVIAYGARQLQPREGNYASTKGELLAVIFFLQYYTYYLLHRPFILRTDNRALTWIRSLESPTGMILRWLEILASFDFTVKHRKGTLHGNADALSRAPLTPHCRLRRRRRFWSVMRPLLSQSYRPRLALP